MKCRFCNTELTHQFIDLVNSPPSNSFLTQNQLTEPEIFYPLKLFVCHECFLVQIDEYKKSSEIFDRDYIYFSSFSSSWLEHCKKYVEKMINGFGLKKNSFVIEIASNDGYLLQYFKEKSVPCLGIEPTASTAAEARKKGIETVEDFFGVSLAQKLKESGKEADLILGNNVLAHVPDINDFVKGMKILLKQTGMITMEFPHLMQLVENNQFDTIYHEHFSYLSFQTVKKVFNTHGLELFDVEEIPTHGGSLRIYARHAENNLLPVSKNVQNLISKEKNAGMLEISYYLDFQKKAYQVKNELLNFLLEAKKSGKKIAAYGAAAKGNTLLNYCGIKNDIINFVVDLSSYKQRKFLPGSHIPVVGEDFLKKEKPDYILILPWNLKTEIKNQLAYIKDWDGKLIIPIPKLEII